MLSAPISETGSLNTDLLGSEDTGIPMAKILDSREGVDPLAEDPLPRESVALETIPLVNPK